MVEGWSNELMRNIRNGPKRAGSGSRMIQGKDIFLVGWQKEINWYEVQLMRKRGTLPKANVKH